MRVCRLYSSPKDIANLKNEIEKRQKEESGEAAAVTDAPAITENGSAAGVSPVEVQS